ncbi:hypothetical protein NDU88_011335 [Pleurodeles waltl]|uniref:Uncharacterized protein n=1 Tax=Pleurodeles waltl TaxID=8319 RepID=A0AAV7QYB7_PLEWA|nr:hypothetical protein NDU88_011335 [Pleurodeles waltl]
MFSLIDFGLVGKPASLHFWGRIPSWGRLSQTTSTALGVRLVYLRASPSPAQGRARPPCPGLLQLNEAQSLGAPRPLVVVGAFPRPQVSRAYRRSYPLRGLFSLLGRGFSGQTRSGTPAAHLVVCLGSAMARVFTQDPGSGRGMGRRLLSLPAQLEPTFQGRDGGSAAPKTAPPGYHLSPTLIGPGAAHFTQIIAGPSGARGLSMCHLWVLGHAP